MTITMDDLDETTRSVLQGRLMSFFSVLVLVSANSGAGKKRNIPVSNHYVSMTLNSVIIFHL